MADMWSKETRSAVMAAIRSRGNKETELALVSLLRVSKISGWRRHTKLKGTPDFAFPRAKLAVFVDGCFWHGCPRCYRRPTSNRKFWDAKVERNKRRDREVGKVLRRLGWKVVRIWAHQLKKPKTVLGRISRALTAPRRDQNSHHLPDKAGAIGFTLP